MTPEPDIAIVIGLLAVGFILFVTETFSIDVTAMILLSIFFLFGYLTPEQAISGFSNPAVLTIAFLFILSHALQKDCVPKVQPSQNFYLLLKKSSKY